ncbi:hypothetical protein MO973_05630 [Paenibacillus sp. TRM 82003]|nr:hypothetical protein [Paenibacillus sp. TRM 82003]
MDAEKRKIIVKEIEHWQRSKLLPDHYCDFLLNLYRDPDATGTVDEQERRKAIVESKPTHWLLLFGSLALICYVGLHFSFFPPLLQIVVFVAVVLALHGTSAYFRHRKPLLSYSLFGIGAFLLLVGGTLMLQAQGTNDWGATAFYVFCCAAIWIAFGLVLRVPWIHLCGWAGVMLAYALVVNRWITPEAWFALQLSWLPLCFLFGWVGWLLGRRAKQAGAVFLIMSCLLWFAPEGYALAWTEQELAIVQTLLIGKVAALGIAAFALRKKWTEWVV